jgi:glycosyltransferase 2 family protein
MSKILLIAIKILVSITIIWFLLNKIDLNRTVQLLLNVHKGYAIAVLGVLLLQIVVSNFRWKIVLFHLNIFAPSIEILRIIWIGLFFNQVLPSSIGGDALRSYYLYKKGYTIGYSMLSVLIDRMIGLIALVMFVIATLLLAIDLVNEPVARWGIFMIAISSIIAITLVLTMDRYTQNLLHWKFIRGFFAVAREGRRLVFSVSPGIKLIATSLLIHILTIIAIIILSVGMGLDLNWLGILIIMPIASLIMVAPISIAGWGVREGVMVIGLGYVGVAPESALALSLLYGILMFIVSLPGLVIWLMSGHLYMHQVK